MYQALYRKYRPKSFNDVVSQDSVKKILINSIKNQTVSHAYLFSGPRGIGKTSIAKIFAKAVNCLDFAKNDDSCLECENCLESDLNSVDILEIDAASNNGVDQIRELKSKVNIVPSKLKYKAYIIDEVHMLSNSAFNALLKTLEEPPSHVIFILATTEFYEVPETIVSRCQCFSFGRISNNDLKDRLKYIADKENITVSEDVLLEIATYANGGLRDAISMLDKLASFSNNNITMDDFITINGLISQSDIKETYESLIKKDAAKLLEIIDKIDNSGYDFNNFIERLMIYIRDLIVESFKNNSSFDVSLNVSLVNELNNLLNALKNSLNPLIMTQVSLLNLVKKEEIVVNNEKKVVVNEKTEIKEVKPKVSEVKTSNTPVIKEEIKKKGDYTINEETRVCRINNALADANLSFKDNFLKNWSKLSEYRLNEKYAKCIQLLEIATAEVVSDSHVILSADRDSTTLRMYENSIEIEEIISKINEHPYKCVYVSKKEFENIKNKYINDKKNGIIYKYQSEKAPLIEKEKKNSELVDKALNLFGSDLVEIEEE